VAAFIRGAGMLQSYPVLAPQSPLKPPESDVEPRRSRGGQAYAGRLPPGAVDATTAGKTGTSGWPQRWQAKVDRLPRPRRAIVAAAA
jgi:hypothetical protein